MARIEHNPRIIHIMADGTVRDSIEGLVVSYEMCPDAYAVIERANERIKKEKKYVDN
jgi:hypothetical protein